MSTRIPAFIRMLGSPNDNEVLAAARALACELADCGAHLEDLAQAWEKAQAEHPSLPKSKPFDYSKVEAAVTLYSQGKNKVTMNKVIRSVVEQIQLRRPYDLETVNMYITARLRALGFKASTSGSTYSRP